jgi:hypothetical protein
MDEEKRVQAFIDLYKHQMERFRQTQDIEWKANFGLWTLLAGAIYLAKEKIIAILTCPLTFLLLFVLLVHVGWLQRIHRSQQFDKKHWVRYRSEALSLLRVGHDPAVFEDEKQAQTNLWTELTWRALEVGITFLLCAVLFIILFSAHK